jgi:hypothetical protein
MSTPYERNPNDPRALVPFDEHLFDATSAVARDNPRGRWITRFHALDEPFQRMPLDWDLLRKQGADWLRFWDTEIRGRNK